ncbi:hypothetical protein ACJMK2_036701, partial [Sinanodonta woodiana]
MAKPRKSAIDKIPQCLQAEESNLGPHGHQDHDGFDSISLHDEKEEENREGEE